MAASSTQGVADATRGYESSKTIASWHLRFESEAIEDLKTLPLVHQGVLHKVQGPLRTVRAYFLFNDRLMTAEPQNKGARRAFTGRASFDYPSELLLRRKCFPLDGIRIRLLSDTCTFDLIQPGPDERNHKTTRLVAESAAHRQSWITELWACIVSSSRVGVPPPLPPPPRYLAADAACLAACAEGMAYAGGCVVGGSMVGGQVCPFHVVEGGPHSAVLHCLTALTEGQAAAATQRASSVLKATLLRMPADVLRMADPLLGGSAIHLLISQANVAEHLSALSAVLGAAPELIDQLDANGFTPLLASTLRCRQSPAGSAESAEVAESAVGPEQLGAAAGGGQEGRTLPVEKRVAVRVLEALLQAGASPDAGCDGTTLDAPLLIAIGARQVAASLALIAAGADVHGTSAGSYMPALHLAVKHGLLPVVTELLKSGVGANLHGPHGSTLHEAARAVPPSPAVMQAKDQM